jgi:hypothetical protein
MDGVSGAQGEGERYAQGTGGVNWEKETIEKTKKLMGI